jgi:hypothetical protein
MHAIRLVAALLLVPSSAFAQSHIAADSNNGQARQLTRTLGPPNPFMAVGGAAAEHNDSYSSDVSPQSGPGSNVVIKVTPTGALCPTLVLDRRGYVFAYCVDAATHHASLRFLDPQSLAVLASLDMPSSGRLGGFYMYVDHDDRIVLGAGNNHLLRIASSKNTQGHWELRVLNNWDLSKNVTGHCGSSACDYLESVTPDWDGRIWFSTEAGAVGTVDPKTGTVHSVTLPKGEQVANSISSSPAGVAVPSDHALYLFSAGLDGTPTVLWREIYDRGTKIKPGQLSHGTGATPVFFGNRDHQYVVITDNADRQEHLLIYHLSQSPDAHRLVCQVSIFSPGASADENAPIGIANSVVVSNTYGYNYTDYSGHTVLPLPGGMTRIDVRPDGSGCDVVWTNPVPSAAVPKLSAADEDIYTIKRTVTASIPQYYFTVIDFRTGRTVAEKLIGNSYALDTFQLAGVIGPHGVLYQPTISGIIQVRPEPARVTP